jgi:NitT/TauT family transport system permease protein
VIDLLKRFNFAGLGFIIALTLVWQVLAEHNLLTSYVPPPSAVFPSLWRGLFVNYDISSQVGVTLLAYAESLGLGALLAIIAGILMGTFRPVYDAFKVIVEFMRPIPSVATIPLAILFFGLGDEMRVVVVTYAVFWLVLINTLYGVRGVDPQALDVARNFGVTGAEALRRVTLPSALASVATGFRIAASVALIVTITVELVAGNSGIGFYISQMEQADRLPPMYAAIIFTGILGYALNWMYVQLERRIVFWTPAAREKVT